MSAPLEQTVADQLRAQKHFALGVLSDHKPWVVCLKVQSLDGLTLAWTSRHDTVHSQALTQEPTVSICAFSKTDEFGEFGFYARATASVTSEPIGDVCTYQAVIYEAWYNGDEHRKRALDMKPLEHYLMLTGANDER